MRPIIFAAVFLAAAVAAAQTPKAVITGPKESRCGALVVLDATESQGVGRLWLLAVSPEETSFLPVESGLKCIFASPTAGRYEFVLVVSGVNANGGPAAEIGRHTITLSGGTPGPDPGPAPNPDPVPNPTNPYPTPAAELRTATAAIAAKGLSPADATALAKLYDQARKLVASAPAAIAAGTKPEIGTTGELRAWLIAAGQPLGLGGRYPGVADAVETYLAARLGTRVRAVTSDDATALGALAWAVYEAGT